MRVPDPSMNLPEPGRRDLTVEVTSLDARGRSGRRAALATVLVVGALGAAVLSGALFPAGPTASARPTGIAAVTPPVANAPSGSPLVTPSGIEPSLPTATLPDLWQIDWPVFADWVRSTSIDGTVVLLVGRLAVVRTACTDRAGICPGLSIPGLDLPVVAAPELLPWDRDPVAGATLVLVAGGGGLTYLGTLPTDVPSPVSITTLLENPNRFLTLNDLYPVDAALRTADSGACGTSDSGAGVPPGCGLPKFLVDPGSAAAAGDSLLGAPVAVTGTIIGMARGLPDSTQGIYLIRRMFRPACPSTTLPAGVRCDQEFVIRPQLVALVSAETAVRVTAVQ